MREKKNSNTYSMRLDTETRSKLKLLSLAKGIPIPDIVRVAVDLLWDKEEDRIKPRRLDVTADSRRSGLLRELIDAAVK